MGHLTAAFTPKRGFEDKAHAKRWLMRMRGPVSRDDLKVYRCGICPNYHVGGPPKEER